MIAVGCTIPRLFRRPAMLPHPAPTLDERVQPEKHTFRRARSRIATHPARMRYAIRQTTTRCACIFWCANKGPQPGTILFLIFVLFDFVLFVFLPFLPPLSYLNMYLRVQAVKRQGRFLSLHLSFFCSGFYSDFI